MCRHVRKDMEAGKKKTAKNKCYKILAAVMVMLTTAGFLAAHESALPGTRAIFRDSKESHVTLTVAEDVYFSTQALTINGILNDLDTTGEDPTVAEDVYDTNRFSNRIIGE